MAKANINKRAKYIGEFQGPRIGSAIQLSIEENLAIAYQSENIRGFDKLGVLPK